LVDPGGTLPAARWPRTAEDILARVRRQRRTGCKGESETLHQRTSDPQAIVKLQLIVVSGSPARSRIALLPPVKVAV